MGSLDKHFIYFPALLVDGSCLGFIFWINLKRFDVKESYIKRSKSLLTQLLLPKCLSLPPRITHTHTLTGNSAPFLASAALNSSRVSLFSPSIIMNSARKNKNKSNNRREQRSACLMHNNQCINYSISVARVRVRQFLNFSELFTMVFVSD